MWKVRLPWCELKLTALEVGVIHNWLNRSAYVKERNCPFAWIRSLPYGKSKGMERCTAICEKIFPNFSTIVYRYVNAKRRKSLGNTGLVYFPQRTCPCHYYSVAYVEWVVTGLLDSMTWWEDKGEE